MPEKKELAYFLTLFKVKGHKRWRASLKGRADGFDKEMKQNGLTGILERKEFVIDRLTGDVQKVTP